MLYQEEVLQDKKRLDTLRKQINTELWTGERVTSGDKLISLKDIIKRNTKDSEPDYIESYIQVSNNLEHRDGSQSSDKDRQITVTRTDINFNGKDCKLVTFTDITF